VYDLMVEVLERPVAEPLPHPVLVKRKKG